MKTKPARITITQRHTGRYYLGMDQTTFIALYAMLLESESLRKMHPYPFSNPDPITAHRAYLITAIKSAIAKIRAAANSVHPNPPIH